MYRLATHQGDCIPVPRVLFSKLAAPGADDARFRVALQVLATGNADAKALAAALRLPVRIVEKALEFWEGAGLLEREAAVPQVNFAATARRRLTTPEVASAADTDPMLGRLVGELQRIFGGVVSQSDINVFSTLYVTDGFPADMILIAATHCTAQHKASARYIEKLLLGWRRDGIETCEQADAYLRLLALRAKREQEAAKVLGIDEAGLTLAEKKRIAQWYEEFAYGPEMIRAARLNAGENDKNVRYIGGILKKWHSKGYATPQDVAMAQGNHNVRIQGPAPEISTVEGGGILGRIEEYVPFTQRGGRG